MKLIKIAALAAMAAGTLASVSCQQQQTAPAPAYQPAPTYSSAK